MKKDLEVIKALIMEMSPDFNKAKKQRFIDKNDVDLYPGNMGDEMSAPTSIQAKQTPPKKAKQTPPKKAKQTPPKQAKQTPPKQAKQTPPKDKINLYPGNMGDEMSAPTSIEEDGYIREEDHEVSMANNSIDSIIWAATELKKHLQGGERDIPAWIQDHITNAENYILQAAKNYHEYGAEEQPEMPDEMSLQEMIKKVGSKYNVYSKKGKKLGSHPSKKKAKKQMAAIEISKQGK